MKEFIDFEKACKALRKKGSGWFLDPTGWVLRPKTIEEYAEQWEFERDAVTVTVEIPTSADLHADEMRDEDWINLGKMVAEVAAMQRGLRG